MKQKSPKTLRIPRTAKTGLDREQVEASITLHPLLVLLDPKLREQTVAASRVVPYRTGRAVLREGDPPDRVFCLLRGSVRVFHRASDGGELLVKLFRAPALFGEMEVLVGAPFLEFVTTLEPSEIMQIPAAVFLRLVDAQPHFTKALAIDLSARLCIATTNERALGFLEVETRLANLLLDYAELSGREVEGGILIEVALSQDGMAHDLAISRRSLIRALEKMRKAGVVAKQKGRYVVYDLDALRARSGRRMSLAYKLT